MKNYAVSRRCWHKYLVMREMAAKNLGRGVDTDWPLFVNWQAKCKHLPKYHGTKCRGQKRWLAKENSITKVTKGDENEKTSN